MDDQFVSIGKAAKMLGMSIDGLRKWAQPPYGISVHHAAALVIGRCGGLKVRRENAPWHSPIATTWRKERRGILRGPGTTRAKMSVLVPLLPAGTPTVSVGIATGRKPPLSRQILSGRRVSSETRKTKRDYHRFF